MKEDRVKKIIAIARPMFEENGVRHTTVSAIMDEAGITRELFYYYFNNKKELVHAVLDDYASDIAANAQAWSDDLDAGRARFDDLVTYMRRPIRNDEQAHAAMRKVIVEAGLLSEMDDAVVDHTLAVLRPTSFYSLCECCAPIGADRALRYILDAFLTIGRQGALFGDDEMSAMGRAALQLPDDI